MARYEEESDDDSEYESDSDEGSDDDSDGALPSRPRRAACDAAGLTCVLWWAEYDSDESDEDSDDDSEDDSDDDSDDSDDDSDNDDLPPLPSLDGATHVCEMCGVCFTSSSGLKKHRLKFCVGSKLHKNVLAKKNELRQPHFDPDALASYLSGEPLPAGVPRAAGRNLDKLSVAQLRQQLTHDAAKRAQAAKAASRAAEQLKERREEMEAQQREVEERLRRQRMVRDAHCFLSSSVDAHCFPTSPVDTHCFSASSVISVQ